MRYVILIALAATTISATAIGQTGRSPEHTRRAQIYSLAESGRGQVTDTHSEADRKAYHRKKIAEFAAADRAHRAKRAVETSRIEARKVEQRKHRAEMARQSQLRRMRLAHQNTEKRSADRK